MDSGRQYGWHKEKQAMNVLGGEPIGDGSDDAGPCPTLIPRVVRFNQQTKKLSKKASVARKDVGHGGLDEWFSGHGKDKGKAQWGDWVSISPVRKQLQSGRVVEPGDIVGQCGISDSPDWRQYTKGGQDPLKCMPRKKALAMSKEQRAALARGKARAERSSGNTGAPVMTRTFGRS